MKHLLYILTFFAFFCKVEAQTIKSKLIEPRIFDKIKEYTQAEKDYYLIYLDFNDCYNCNIAYRYLLQSKTIDNRQFLFILNNVPSSKVTAFRKEMGIPDSSKVTTDSTLRNYFSRLTQLGQKRSILAKFDNGFVIYYLLLNEIAKDDNLNKLVNNVVQVGKKAPLVNDTFFYSSFSKAVNLEDKLIFITSPKQTLLSFDTIGRFLKYFAFSEDSLIRIAREPILSRFHDSIRYSRYNSFDSIKLYYNVDIKPLGLELLKLSAYYRVNANVLCIAGSISLPITKTFDKIIFAPGLFLFYFDKNLNLIDVKEYQINIAENSGPVDFYGFYLSEKGKKLNMAVLSFENGVVNQQFIGNWKLIGGKFIYNDMNPEVAMDVNLFKEYSKEHKQLATMFNPIGDSLLSFVYYPGVFKTATNESVSLLWPNERKYIYYKNELFTPVVIGNKNFFVSIEQIDNRTYLTLFDGAFNRIVSKPFKADAQKLFKLFCCLDGSSILGISYEEEGTCMYKIDYLKLLD